jgi:hypothetical protein
VHFLAAERLWLLNVQAHNNADSSVYAAFDRRDVMAKTTWLLPFRDIRRGGSGVGSGGEHDALLTCLPDRQELLVRP